MKLVDSVILDEEKNLFLVPIWGRNSFCHFTWLEDEDADDFMMRATCSEKKRPHSFHCRYKLNFWNKVGGEIKSEFGYESLELEIYEVYAVHPHSEKFYLCTEHLNDPEEFYHAICIPYHKLNLIKFLNEYFSPLCGRDYTGI